MKSEAQIQAEIVKYFHNTFCLRNNEPRGIIFSVPNELAGNNKISTMQAKATGLKAGVSDLVVCKPCGEIVFVEVKDHKGKQSEKQIEFEQTIKSLGFRYLLVRSLEQFKEVI